MAPAGGREPGNRHRPSPSPGNDPPIAHDGEGGAGGFPLAPGGAASRGSRTLARAPRGQPGPDLRSRRDRHRLGSHAARGGRGRPGRAAASRPAARHRRTSPHTRTLTGSNSNAPTHPVPGRRPRTGDQGPFRGREPQPVGLPRPDRGPAGGGGHHRPVAAPQERPARPSPRAPFHSRPTPSGTFLDCPGAPRHTAPDRWPRRPVPHLRAAGLARGGGGLGHPGGEPLPVALRDPTRRPGNGSRHLDQPAVCAVVVRGRRGRGPSPGNLGGGRRRSPPHGSPVHR